MESKNFKVQSNTKELSNTIIEVTKCAEKNGLICWINYGALLGIVRENKLLPWNNDAHLCCFYEDNFKNKCLRIADELERKGYHTYFYPTVGALNIKKTGVDVNINCVWRKNDECLRPHEEAEYFSKKYIISHVLYWLARSFSIYTPNISFKKFCNSGLKEKIKLLLILKNKLLSKKIREYLFLKLINLSKKGGAKFQKTIVPAYFYDEIIEIDFYNEKVYAPKNNTELLEYIYGKDWKIPLENWSFYKRENHNKSNMQYCDKSWNYNKVDFI